MRHLFIRCNGGHYFRGQPSCPFDGWTSDGVAEAIAAFSRLDPRAQDRGLEELRNLNLPEGLLCRLLVIEFGDARAAFEAVVPDRYLHNGKHVPADQVGLELY